VTAPGAGPKSIGNIVCDLDGVVYVGEDAVPGAGRALDALERAGYRVVLATNNSTRNPADVAARIHALTGFRSDPSGIVTSSIAAAALLTPADSPALVVGEDGVAAALADTGIEVTVSPDSARSVVVGLARHVDYELIDAAARAVRHGARFVATNTDATFPTPRGPVPGAGAIVAAVATASGASPEVAGKPHEPMRRAVRQRLGAGPTWVVGDRPETDLALAAAEGWGKVLVLSGIATSGNITGEFAPDIVVPTLAELPGALGSQ
jgi:HAD superfamily hydrolase (TIGR01450 family)